jgi:CheY-like chemotaxis protein
MNAAAPCPPRIWRPRARILVVDDLNKTRHVLASLLKSEGYDAELAATGSIALQLCQLVRWHLVLLDMDLPEVNGIRLHERMKELANADVLPVVFMTTRVDDKRWRAAADLDRARVLAKPFTVSQLITAVEQCLYTGPGDKVYEPK